MAVELAEVRSFENALRDPTGVRVVRRQVLERGACLRAATRQVARRRHHELRTRGHHAAGMGASETLRSGHHGVGLAERGRACERFIVLGLEAARGEDDAVRGPQRSLVGRRLLGEGLRETLRRSSRRAARSPADCCARGDVVARDDEIMGVERALGLAGGLIAQRGRAFGAEALHAVDDLGCVVRPGVVLDDGAVVHQRLALTRRQPVVVPQVDRGGGDAVDGAAREQERIQGGEEHRAREHPEGPDGVVDQVRATVVAVVGQQPARRWRHRRRRARDVATRLDDGIGMLVEQVLERQTARFARRLEPGRQELHVVGEPGRSLPAGVALAIERLHVARRRRAGRRRARG